MKLRSIFFVCAALVLLSCREEGLKEPLFNGEDVTFVAVTEETRVAFNDDLTQIMWKAGDSISILDGFTNVCYVTSEGGRKVTFTSESGISDEALDVYAVYPCDSTARRLEDGLEVIMPSSQRVDTTVMDPKASVAVAYASPLKTETQLDFDNICSYFKFTVPAEDKIVQVILEAGNDEWLAGTVKAAYADGELQTEVVEGRNRIVFSSESPMSGTYVIALLPSVLQDGLNVGLKSADGRSATHHVIAKDENDVISALTFARNKINRFALSFKESVWKNAPELKVMDVAATSVTVCWSETGFADPEADFASRYRVDIYEDADCKALVNSVEWEVAEAKTFPCPALCLSGLLPQKDYWVTVTNSGTQSTSLPEKVSTPADAAVVLEGQASEGQVILLETFAQLGSGADPVNVAWGILDGALTTAPGVMDVWSNADLSGTRLADWAEKTEGANYVGPGYVRVGDSKNQKDALYTPALSSLKECSTLEISFKAAPYSSDYGAGGTSKLSECYAEVWVVNSDEEISAGVVELNDTPTAWTECSVEAYNVLPTSRIAIGGAFGEKSKASGGKQYARIYLDDVRVKLLKYEQFAQIKPELKIEKTFWSDSYVSWTCSGEPVGYKVYVNGEAVTDMLEPGISEYHVTGLPVGSTSDIAVSALYADDKEAFSDVKSVKTGSIVQLTKNVSPTSVSVSIENKAGENTNNNNPCLYVELMDSSDPETAGRIYSTYVLDAQIQSPASPFMPSYVVNSEKGRAPLNIAFGGLEPGRDYWLRVKSVDRYEFLSYQPAAPADSYCESSNGNSDFSLPVKVITAVSHTPEANEVLYQGFDDLMIHADFINCAVGSVPAFKADGKSPKDLTLETTRNWAGGWSFYGLRVAFGNTQLAAHYAWASQLTTSGDIFGLSSENANGTINGTAPAVGAKVYRFDKFDSCLSGWYTSNNTFASPGYIHLGAYFNVGDSGLNKQRGMIATPALDSPLLSATPVDCTLSFRGFVIQGRSTALQVWVYDAASKTWAEVKRIDIHNSTGSTQAALDYDSEAKTFVVTQEYSADSETHKWYDYNCQLSLKQGDIVALVAEKEDGATMIDEIKITTK